MKLSGYKTYLSALVIGGVAAAKALGYLDEASANMILSLAAAAGLAALRAAVGK